MFFIPEEYALSLYVILIIMKVVIFSVDSTVFSAAMQFQKFM